MVRDLVADTVHCPYHSASYHLGAQSIVALFPLARSFFLFSRLLTLFFP